jgi:peptidyl-prolyl cis-trans isomerase D
MIASEALMAKDKPTKITSKKHLARLERERRQTRIITSIAIGLIVIIVGLIGYGVLYETYLKGLQPVVTVNGESVNMREFQMRVRVTRQQYISQYMQINNQYQQYSQFAQMLGIDPTTDPSLSQTFSQLQSQMDQIQTQLADPSLIGQQVIDEITNDLIIRQYAKANGIVVTAADIDKAIQDGYGYYPNGTPTPTPTGTAFNYPTWSATQNALITPTSAVTLGPTDTPTSTATITPSETPTLAETLDLTAIATISPEPTQTSTATTVPSPTPTATIEPTATLTSTITATPSITPTATPYTLDSFQSNYKSGVSYYAKLGMTETDFRKIFFESPLYRQRVLEIKTTTVAHEQDEVWARHILVADEVTAKVVRAELTAGEDFAALAATFSTDTGSKSSGGDLGWFSKGKMVAEFETAAWSLQVGEISQPVKTSFGWHIIQVLGHENRPLTDTEYQTAVTTAFNQWLTDQRTVAKIIVNSVWNANTPDLPNLDGAFADMYASATAYADQALKQPTSTPTP